MEKVYIIALCVLFGSCIGMWFIKMQPKSCQKQDQIKIMELASAFILSRAIHIAAEIKIADLMVNGPQNITTLAQQSGMNEDALYRLLRLLASYNIFSHDASNNFSLTPLAQQLVSTDPDSLWSWVTYHNDTYRWAAYGDMKYSIETDKPAFNHVFGKGYFDFLSDNPELGAQFDEGMKNIASGETTHIVNSYNFAPYHTITDIGGGKGGLLTEILHSKKSSSDQKGILFDLPYVKKSAEEYLLSMHLTDRITFVPSTGFFAVPQGAELYILKRILHDWNDTDSITILKNCYNAMQHNSRLLIIENIVSQENVRDFSKDIDIAMMVLFGGKERTKTEWETLLDQANLKIINIYKTPSMVSIIEVQKK
jgi:hypothetical protein